MLKTWKSHPVYTQMKEFLERKGPMTDVELFDMVKATNEDVGFSEFNKTLMRMEIGGTIYVAERIKGKRRVELVEQPQS
jgi:hypothetical protein